MRRYVTSLASVALAIHLTSRVALFASEVASAATNTFSNSTQITIPDRGAATPYPSAISVSGLGTVTDVDLKLNGFSHTSPYDMEVELVGPSGPSIMMMADAGGSYDVSNIDVTLDDEAATGLPTWSQLSTGSYRPTSPLSAFDGTNPNGVWELYVHNAWEKGSISGGWSVTITSSDDPPPLDTSPPDTTLREKPSPFTSNVNPKFSFRSSEGGSTFTCKLDDGAYQTCTSPKSYFLVSEGQHTFAVKAKDAANNVDPSPAEYTWTVDSLDPKVTFTERPGPWVGETGSPTT
jgi:subtilisin-like proprotein convertase family protein